MGIETRNRPHAVGWQPFAAEKRTMCAVRLVRFASAAFSALLGFALVAPSASLACQPSKARCPGMPPELAALCHHEGVTAPDCCKKERPAPTRRAPETTAAPECASTPAARPIAELAVEAFESPRLEGIVLDRAAARHELGLFTLNAVFRI